MQKNIKSKDVLLMNMLKKIGIFHSKKIFYPKSYIYIYIFLKIKKKKKKKKKKN